MVRQFASKSSRTNDNRYKTSSISYLKGNTAVFRAVVYPCAGESVIHFPDGNLSLTQPGNIVTSCSVWSDGRSCLGIHTIPH